MTPSGLGVAFLAAALALATPGAAIAASPFEPFRQLLKDPSGTMERVTRGKPARAKPAPEAKADDAAVDADAADADAPDPAAAAAADKAAPADVPTPRVRPSGPGKGSDRFANAFAEEDAPPPAKTDASADWPPKVLADPPPRVDGASAADTAAGAEAAPKPEPSAKARRAAKADLAAKAGAAPRPDPAAKSDTAPKADRALEPEPAAKEADIVLPNLKPKRAALAAVEPARSPAKRTAPTSAATTAAACAAKLAALGIEAVPLAPISEGSCGIAAPAAVSALANGAVDFTEKAILNCAVAEKLDEWMSEDVQPAARRHLGGPITGLRIAASYDCRGRNRDPKAKLSEHAFGNAIDISAFRIGKRWIEVSPRQAGADAAFMNEIRKDACGPFTTVLGPGVAMHDEHFHFDLAKRRTAGPSKGLYCK